jgi:hypothetical protein
MPTSPYLTQTEQSPAETPCLSPVGLGQLLLIINALLLSLPHPSLHGGDDELTCSVLLILLLG